MIVFSNSNLNSSKRIFEHEAAIEEQRRLAAQRDLRLEKGRMEPEIESSQVQ